MSKVSWLASTCSASALVFAAGLASPGWAQPQSNVQVAEASRLQEVIVTARKRQESILNVPVVETAIPQQQL